MKKSFPLAMMIVVIAFAPAGAQSGWTYFDNNADIYAFYQTGDSLWIGTNGGLIVFDLATDRIISKITAGELLADNSVRAITRHKSGVYVGTDHGFAVFNGGRASVYTPERRRFYRDIRSISVGPTGKVYLGTFGHGVGAFDRKSVEWITRADSLLSNTVFAVEPTDTNTIYFATSVGLCAFKDSVWVNYQAGAGLPRGQFTHLIPLGGEQFYVLIRGRGIYRFDGRRAIRVRMGNGFAGEDVVTIAVASDRTLWAAGRHGGIASYKNRRWRQYGLGDDEFSHARWRSAYAGPGGSVFFWFRGRCGRRDHGRRCAEDFYPIRAAVRVHWPHRHRGGRQNADRQWWLPAVHDPKVAGFRCGARDWLDF